MKKPRKPQHPGVSFATEVARIAVEEALRLSTKNASNRFVALVVPPRSDDVEVYEEAVLRYLRSFLNSLPGDPRPCHVEVHDKTILRRLATYSEVRHVVLVVPNPEVITSEDRLTVDRTIILREPTSEDFSQAVRTTYGTLMSQETADFLVGKPLVTLDLAFPEGRSYSAAIRKARAYFRNAEQTKRGSKPVPAVKTPRGSRTLDHLPGYGEAKVWGLRLADDLADWKAGRIDWSDVDKGVVLMGPPGVGKTVFARALANSCGVSLIHTSAARWVAKGHLGDALKAMRWSFTEARSRAPAILFVDEIDSFPSRDREGGDNSGYYQQLVNGFLECLDGIEGRDGVVVVGATNRIQEVEPAVLRSGRLERVIEIPLPDADVRYEILRLNLPALPPGRSKQFELTTEGWSGADVEQFARDVARECRLLDCEIDFAVVEAMLPSLVQLDFDSHFRIAIHEAGHALYARLFERRTVQSMAVSPYRATKDGIPAGGVVMKDPLRVIRTEDWYRGQIAIAMAGIAAERLLFGVHSDGSGGSEISDLASATHLATCMVAAFGMDGTWSAEPTTDPKVLSTLRKLDVRIRNQVEAVIDRQFKLVSERLASNKPTLNRLAEAVMEKGALGADAIDGVIFSKGPTDHATSAPGARS